VASSSELVKCGIALAIKALEICERSAALGKKDNRRSSNMHRPEPFTQGGMGKATPRYFFHHFTRQRPLASGQRENHRNLGVDFHRFTVQNVGPVLPLLHGFDGCRGQHRMPTDQVKVFNTAILADLSLQQHTSLDACLSRQGRVGWLNFTQQQALGHTLRHPYALRRSYLGYGHRGRIDDSAYHSPHLSARHSARNPTHHASHGIHRRWSLFFFDHLHFFWNLGWRTELAVNDIGLNLLDPLDGSRRRWRRWWRRRWRRHQEG